MAKDDSCWGSLLLLLVKKEKIAIRNTELTSPVSLVKGRTRADATPVAGR